LFKIEKNKKIGAKYLGFLDKRWRGWKLLQSDFKKAYF